MNFTKIIFQQNPSNLAVVDDDTEITYGELQDRIKSVAHALRSQGLDREQRVGIVMPDSIESLCLILGSMYAGMIPVPLDYRSSDSHQAYCLAHADCRLIVRDPAEVKRFYKYEPVDKIDDSHEDAACIFIYTSGTTGHPKAVVHCHRALGKIGYHYGKMTLGITEQDRMYSTAKLFFSFGLLTVWSAMTNGATLILSGKIPLPNTIAETIKRTRPTTMTSVPVVYGHLLKIKDLDVSSLRICQSGGDRLPETLYNNWKSATGKHLYNSFGTTECCTAYFFNDNEQDPTSIGKPIDGYSFEIRDPQGRPVPDGESGELYCKAPSAGLMYWHDKHWSEKMFGEWMKTNDICIKKPDGYYQFLGRASDIIKVNGNFVDVGAIEEKMMSYQGVQEAVVVGEQDSDGRVKIKAFIVVNNKELNADEIKNYLRSVHSPVECPREINIIDQLPRTENGKVKRTVLKGWTGNGSNLSQ